MIYTNCLIPLLHVSKLYKLSYDITHLIYYYIINNSAQLIIDKWYSYVYIHNINLCTMANKITLLQGHTFTGDTIFYYNLHDKNLYNTLYTCSKYIKPYICSKYWWLHFIQNCYNGLYFIDNRNQRVVRDNLIFF